MDQYSPVRVIFICSGNICRSPFGEVVAVSEFRKRGRAAAVVSMGTLGLEGYAADRKMVGVAESMGYDLRGHRSRGLVRPLLRVADCIFVMEQQHFDVLASYVPDAVERIYFLGSYSGSGQLEIADPVGRSVRFFEIIAREIEFSVQNALSALFFDDDFSLDTSGFMDGKGGDV